jgi:hypothetical protein
MVSDEKNLKISVNQKQESPVAAMFLMDPEEMSNLDRGPPIYASYQESVHLVKRFQMNGDLVGRIYGRSGPL